MIRINLLKPKLYLPANEYCCKEFAEAIKDERLRPGLGRWWFYELNMWVTACPFCQECPFCGANLRGE